MSIVLSDSMRSSHSSIDPYGSTKTCEKTSLMDLKSVYGICHYRDKYETEGTGTVTNENSLFELSIQGAADKAALISMERGTYVAGFSCECGIGLDANATTLQGDQTLDFGYFDDNDGYFFRMQSGEVTLHVRKAGTTVDIVKENWNGDHGKHSVLDFTRGIVWIINFTYYGLGSILFSIVYSDSKGAQINRLLHSYSSPSGLSCCNPNLPINCALSANGTAAPVKVYIGGRQFSIQGQFDPKFRVTQTEESVTDVGNTVTHVVSYTKNAGHLMCSMKMYQIDCICTAAMYIYIRIGTVLTNATYTAAVEPADCFPGVSGLVRDIDATAVTSGLLLFTKLVPSGYTSFDIPTSVNIDERNITIACRAVSAAVDVHMVVRIKEYF